MGPPVDVGQEKGQCHVDQKNPAELVEHCVAGGRTSLAVCRIEPGPKQSEQGSGGADSEYVGGSEQIRRQASARGAGQVEPREGHRADLLLQSWAEDVEEVHVEEDVHCPAVEKCGSQASPPFAHLNSDHVDRVEGERGGGNVAAAEYVIPNENPAGDGAEVVHEGFSEFRRCEAGEEYGDIDGDQGEHHRAGPEGWGLIEVPGIDDALFPGRPDALRALLADGCLVGAVAADGSSAVAARQICLPVGMDVADGGCGCFAHRAYNLTDARE